MPMELLSSIQVHVAPVRSRIAWEYQVLAPALALLSISCTAKFTLITFHILNLRTMDTNGQVTSQACKVSVLTGSSTHALRLRASPCEP